MTTRPLDAIDTEVVEAATCGSPEALDRIVRAAAGPAYNVALRILGSHPDAEEAAQEVLIRIVTRLGSFRGDAKFSTWALSVATRAVIDLARARDRRPTMTFDEFSADLAAGRDDEAESRAEDAVLLSQVKVGCGRALLQCLDVDHRVSYVLGEILEFDGAEVAQMLEVPAATHRKRLQRARERVSTHLRMHCSVVRAEAPCACHRRLRPAVALGRLDARDAAPDLDVAALSSRVRALDGLRKAAAYYRADPQATAPDTLLPRIRAWATGAV